MTRKNRFCSVVAVLVLLLFSNATQSVAQQVKAGKVSGIFSWVFPLNQAVEVEKGRYIWGGLWTGSFRNDAGDGFLHGSAWLCTAVGDLKNNTVVHNNGDCAVTDRDGDKAFFTWQCIECPIDEFRGTWLWTAGTGKYAGLTGQGSYHQMFAGKGVTGIGWWTWKGDWKLP